MSFQTKQIFGYLGAIPFITLSILPWISSNLAETSLRASSMYGAIILSFLGGMVWGWRKAKFFDLFIGILLSALAILIIFFSFEYIFMSNILCFVSFAGFYFFEMQRNPMFLNPPEYAELRLILTLLVTICYFMNIAFIFNPYT